MADSTRDPTAEFEALHSDCEKNFRRILALAHADTNNPHENYGSQCLNLFEQLIQLKRIRPKCVTDPSPRPRRSPKAAHPEFRFSDRQ